MVLTRVDNLVWIFSGIRATFIRKTVASANNSPTNASLDSSLKTTARQPATSAPDFKIPASLEAAEKSSSGAKEVVVTVKIAEAEPFARELTIIPTSSTTDPGGHPLPIAGAESSPGPSKAPPETAAAITPYDTGSTTGDIIEASSVATFSTLPLIHSKTESGTIKEDLREKSTFGSKSKSRARSKPNPESITTRSVTGSKS
jgi:hypothetical protein